MPRSLLDGVQLAAVRQAAQQRTGIAATVAACLVEGGVLTLAADDPEWPDRDRLVVASSSLAAAFGDNGFDTPVHVEGGRALAVAAGMAAGAAAEGGVFRVFCLLDGSAVDDGAFWEAAAAARASSLVAVVLARSGACRRAQRLLDAAGWRITDADADAVPDMMGALDRMCAEDATRPGAVLAVRG